MAVISVLITGACSEPTQIVTEESSVIDDTSQTVEELSMTNPFFQQSPLYLNYPPFDRIDTSHYLPAFERGMVEQLAQIDAITGQEANPTFENTILAMERSGQLLNRVETVFFSMAGAHTNDSIRALEQELAPQLAAHGDSILLNSPLYARVNQLYEGRLDLGLNPQALRLLEQYQIDFVRAGAGLTAEQQQQMREINAEIAVLQTQYNQNVLSEVNDVAIVVDSREELSGLSEALITAAEEEAVSRDMPGKFVIPLLNTSGQPGLASLQNRTLRQRIHNTSLSRGSRGGEFSNVEILSDVLRLRASRAQLLGYNNHAEYILESRTAGTVEAVNQRLAELALPAAENARAEANDLQQLIEEEGLDLDLEAWDWQYYTEKLRVARYQFDESQLQAYFEIDNVLQRGVFFAAEKTVRHNF